MFETEPVVAPPRQRTTAKRWTRIVMLVAGIYLLIRFGGKPPSQTPLAYVPLYTIGIQLIVSSDYVIKPILAKIFGAGLKTNPFTAETLSYRAWLMNKLRIGAACWPLSTAFFVGFWAVRGHHVHGWAAVLITLAEVIVVLCAIGSLLKYGRETNDD